MKEGRLLQETKVLSQPCRRTKLEGEGQEYAVRLGLSIAVIDVVPQVAVRGVLGRLRLDHVAVASIRFIEQGLERQHLRDMGKQRARSGVRKPDAVSAEEARMNVQRDDEGAVRHLPG